MPPQKNEVLMAVAGATGSAIVAWKTLFPWIGDDLKTIRGFGKIGVKLFKSLASNRTIINAFEEHVHNHPKKPFIFFEDRAYSYEFVDSMANRIANLVLTWDLKPGDVIATMIMNEPAFIWTFLGLQKIGMVDALLNFHLKDTPLQHSIKVSKAKALIIGTGEGFVESINEIRDSLGDLPIYVMGKSESELPEGYICMDNLIERSHPVDISPALRSHVTMTSPICYIYTSGTTGLPKPAIVNCAKAISASKMWGMFDFNENDISYVVTPMYHSGATFLGLFNTIDVGGSIAVRRKFSASHYFEDCRKYKVTVVHYVGELFRYILKVPKRDNDSDHCVRAAMGNGLRMDIWKEFQDRFKIPRIVEHFGATEGTSITVNLTNKVGAMGRLSPFMRFFAKYGLTAHNRIVKFDRVNETVIRDKHGRCIDCKAGEEGFIMGLVPETTSEFYVGSKEINEKKFIRNAFKEGDAYFNFGDIIYIDNDYYLYFRDRIGDTFRWKGENVSTREVGEVLGSLDFINDVNVYGVQVPDHDGRAGMAAIVLKDGVKQEPEILQAIYKKCQHSLPSYARPLFLRFKDSFEVTTTMKHRKIDLVKEGYDPEVITDPLFYYDERRKTYTPLTVSSYESFLQSKL